MSVSLIVFVAATVWTAPADPASPGPATNEPAPLETQVEERVEVTAAMPAADDVAAFATTIRGDGIAERGEDLAAVLRRVPGARVREYGGLGRYSTVSLRASTSEQVAVYLDGVPQNRALGGPVDLSFVPATQIDHVTVYRGFGPASLGLGGLGGVVDIRTRAPDGSTDGRLDVLVGELDTTRLSTGWSVRAGERASVRIGAEAIRSEGDFSYLDTGDPFVPDDSTVMTRENNDVDYGSLLLQGVVRETAGGALRLGARVQRRDRGLPGIDGLPAYDARLDEELHDLHVSWSRPGRAGADGVDVMLDVFDQKIEFEDLEGELGIGVQDQTTDLRGGGVSGNIRRSAGRHGIGVRVDLRAEEARVEDRALPVTDRGGADRTRFAVTVEDVVRLGRVTVAPSLRWERIEDDFVSGGEGTLPPSGRDRSDADWTGKLGVAWSASSRSTVRGSVGRFYRYPNMLELFGDRGSVVGNPALRPERGWAAEAGGSWQDDRAPVPWSVELVAFGRESEDLIVLQPNSQATSTPRNLLDARVHGLEGSLTMRFPLGFTLDASGTLQRTEDLSGGPGDGEPIVYQPDEIGWIGAAWRRRALSVGWEATYVGENRIGLDEYLPSRVVHDANLALTLKSGWSVGVDVRNVLDRDTRDVARYPLPGRVVLVHMGWRTPPRALP